jgi:hypothetical protein
MEEVVKELEKDPRSLLLYGHSLFQKDLSMLSKEFITKLISLYAEFDPKNLMQCLKTATNYEPEEALQLCRERKMHQEVVFLMGNMGYYKEGLEYLIKNVGNIQLVCFELVSRDDSIFRRLNLHKMLKMMNYGNI